MLSLLFLVSASQAVTVTTTLSPAQQSYAAAVKNQQLLEEAIVDIANRYDEYGSYMEENDMTYPASLMQFYVYITAATDNDYPTSLVAASFPFEEFQTYMTAFQWYSSLMEKASATTFYLPSEFATMKYTIDETTMAGEFSTSTSSRTIASTSSKYSNNSNSSTSSRASSHTSSTTSSTSSNSGSASSTSEASTSNFGYRLVLSIPDTIMCLLAALLI